MSGGKLPACKHQAPKEKRADRALDQLLLRGVSYDAFLSLAAEEASIDASWFSKERWAFVAENARSDLSEDLKQLRHKPVLLLTGARDGQVDATETMAKRPL